MQLALFRLLAGCIVAPILASYRVNTREMDWRRFCLTHPKPVSERVVPHRLQRAASFRHAASVRRPVAGASPSVGLPYASRRWSSPLAYLTRNTTHCRRRAVVTLSAASFRRGRSLMAMGAPDRLGPVRGVWPQAATRMAYRVSPCRRDIPPCVELRGADVFARALEHLFLRPCRDLPSSSACGPTHRAAFDDWRRVNGFGRGLVDT